jgi:hypothetical protein
VNAPLTLPSPRAATREAVGKRGERDKGRGARLLASALILSQRSTSR